VRTPHEGLQIDMQGKLHGRGAYLHDRRSCWQAGLAGRLAQALKTVPSEEDIERLEAYMQGLPEETEMEKPAG
jgi:predicted RNA-binding protein YlxR (DUF448 family)